MKKIIAFFLCAVIALSSVGCSSAPAASSASSTAVSSAANSSKGETAEVSSSPAASSAQGLEVDKGLLDVTITFPVSMFQGTDNLDQTISKAEAEGIKVTKNSDGSLTYKMSKATHQKLMDEMKQSTVKTLDGIKTGGDYESVSDVKYNDDFSQISILVDKAKYENSMDAFAALNAGFQGMFYQLFDGKDSKSMSVKVDFIDKASGKVLDSVTYPDALNESSSSK